MFKLINHLIDVKGDVNYQSTPTAPGLKDFRPENKLLLN